MCRRFHLPFMPDYEEIFNELFGISILPPKTDLVFGEDIQPRTPITTLRYENSFIAEPMHWNLIPNFAAAFTSKRSWHNIRIESFSRNYQQQLLTDRRCVIPVTAFVEHTRRGDSYEFAHRTDKIMLLGGVYDTWHDKRLSCSIITMPANAIVAEIHHRMPYVLPSGFASSWLQNDPAPERLLHAMQPVRENDLVRRRTGGRQSAPGSQEELF